MNTNNNLISFFNNLGIVVSCIDKEDSLRLWRELFYDDITVEMKAQTPGYNEDFNWHIFSFGLVQTVDGNSATVMWTGLPLREGSRFHPCTRSIDGDFCIPGESTIYYDH